MTLSPDEAAGALRDMAAVETHSQRVYGDRQSSPHLIVWGVLRALGYGLTEPWPQRAWAIWIAIVGMGPARSWSRPAMRSSDSGRACASSWPEQSSRGLTPAGFFLLPAHFALWMAGSGGGALILAGAGFRRV